jgi:hypothetical protein
MLTSLWCWAPWPTIRRDGGLLDCTSSEEVHTGGRVCKQLHPAKSQRPSRLPQLYKEGVKWGPLWATLGPVPPSSPNIWQACSAHLWGVHNIENFTEFVTLWILYELDWMTCWSPLVWCSFSPECWLGSPKPFQSSLSRRHPGPILTFPHIYIHQLWWTILQAGWQGGYGISAVFCYGLLMYGRLKGEGFMANDSKPLCWFWCVDDTLFPCHLDQRSWRGAWTIQVAFTGTSVSLWRWRKMATFLFSLTSAQD